MTKSNRIKPAADIRTEAEFHAVLDGIVKAQLRRDELVQIRDEAILNIRAESDAQIRELEELMAAAVLRAERYACVHREELFKEQKSAASALCHFGFRMGNPILKLLNRKWSWANVIAALKSAGLSQFVATKEAPDKDALKTQLSDAQRAQVGLRVEQFETFFVEPKRDKPAEQRLSGDGKAVPA